MKPAPNSGRVLRATLTGVAMSCVLLVTLAGGLHAHHAHPGEHCDLCLQLDHFGFDLPPLTLESTVGIVGRMAAPDYLPARDHLGSGDDPARAPPFLS